MEVRILDSVRDRSEVFPYGLLAVWSDSSPQAATTTEPVTTTNETSPPAEVTAQEVLIRSMRPDEAGVVAGYHREGIPTGFLSELGAGFLTRLYRGIASSDAGFVFVADGGADGLVGFAAGVTDVGSMYRSVLIRRWWSLAGPLLRHLLRVATWRRVYESLRYPKQVEGAFPSAELLSIVVSPPMRGKGVAQRLMDAVRTELAGRGCDVVKVLVGAELPAANAFYVKYGFRLAGSIRMHGSASNVYVIETQE